MESTLQLTGRMDGRTLVIQVTGRLDNGTAAQLKDYYDAEGAQNPHDQLILDAEELDYISSAGLRSLLHILKAESARVIMKNVKPEAYDVLEMTGFTDLLHAEKALREVSVEGCEVIGRGALGTVYRLDDETILKLYAPEVPIDLISRERERARLAFVMGVPTAISYEVVRSGERNGVVFELLKAETLSAHIRQHPDELESRAEEYASFIKQLHQTDVSDTDLPNVKDQYRSMVERARSYLGDEKADACLRLIDAVPEGTSMLHGDTHPNNIMLQNGELILIDMAELSAGCPLFDFGGIFLGIKFAGSVDPRLTEQFVGITYPQAEYIWDKLFTLYFDADEAEVQRRQKVVGQFGLLKISLLPCLAPSLPEALKNFCRDITNREFFPHIDEIIESVKQW